MGKGEFIISYELLCQALRLPEGTKIIGILRPVWPPDAAAIGIEHPDIAPITEIGACGHPKLQRLNPTFKTDYDGGKTEYAVKFIGWN